MAPRPGGGDDARIHGAGARTGPIPGIDAPLDRVHAQRAGLAYERAADRAVRGAEQARRVAGGPADGALGAEHLANAAAGHVGMRERVIADRIPLGQLTPQQSLVAPNLPADDEEGGVDPEAPQDCQDPRRVGPGPVVEGEGHHPARARAGQAVAGPRGVAADHPARPRPRLARRRRRGRVDRGAALGSRRCLRANGCGRRGRAAHDGQPETHREHPGTDDRGSGALSHSTIRRSPARPGRAATRWRAASSPAGPAGRRRCAD